VRFDLHHKHQYRLAMCGHKAVEVAGVCVYTRLGKKIDRLAEPFTAGQPIAE